MRIKTWQIALVLLLLSALLPMCLVSALAQQKVSNPLEESCKGGHITRKNFSNNVRTAFPLMVMEINTNRLNYAIEAFGNNRVSRFQIEGTKLQARGSAWNWGRAGNSGYWRVFLFLI